MAPPTEISQSNQVFHIDAFDVHVTTWDRWVKRFENAIAVFGADAKKKNNLILHYMGTSAYNVLCDKAMPKSAEELSYKEIGELLSKHFNPKPNEIVENYKFHLRKQGLEESCDEFLTALRKLSANCNFGAYCDTAIRNQFIFGLRNGKIQSRLLEKEGLTLETAVNVAKTYEAAEKGGMELHQKANIGAEAVNKVYKKNKTNQHVLERNKNDRKQSEPHTYKDTKNKVNRTVQCYRCGNNNHLANECKHKNIICNFCKKRGHMRKVCFAGKNQIAQIFEHDKTSSDVEIEELLQISDITTTKADTKLRSKISCALMVEGKKINFEIDTGAPVTIMSVSDAQKHFHQHDLKKADIELYSYCRTEIKCCGFICVKVRTTEGEVAARIYIVESERKPLLGREWLRVVKMDWHKILRQHDAEAVNKIQVREVPIDQLLQQFPKVFSNSTGKIAGLQAKLHLKPNAVPKFVKARRVPFSLLPAVERELEKQVQDGLLVKVDQSEWATPVVVVPKRDGSIRLCGDYKVTLNPALLVDEHPLPTIEELFSSMAGGTKFTKIDLSQAYLQLEVEPADQHLLTLSTHKGLYTPTRLMFGVACAPAKWQRLMEQLLHDIPGVTVFLDDIKITAPDDESHMQRLTEVLRRLDKYNMRVNLQKSEFLKDCIEYCGYVIDKNGISKMKSRVAAIQNMKRPQNKDEVRSFVGFVNYYGRFIQNLSTILYPLNRLLHNTVEFEFDEKCEAAFNEIKSQMMSNTVLRHYDPKLPLLLAVDASPVGVGAVLSQIDADNNERPIQFASQTLNETQQRYSQVDKEAYAIIFGVRKFFQYLIGRKFTLITDNKAISQIFSPNKGLPTLTATRMQHYAIYLAAFNYDIQLKRSAENGNADGLSRLPENNICKSTEEVDVIEILAIENLPVKVKDLCEATAKEPEIQNLLHSLKCGRECNPKDRFGIDQTEFALQSGCILRGIRVYIPKQLRSHVLQELHTGHFGKSKMKTLARAYCWWPGLDADVDNLVENCRACQMYKPNPKASPVHCWLPPGKVFERVHVDFAGPFMGKYFFVLIDAYSKWPEVHVIPNMTAEVTIEKCKKIFATFGIPNILVSDHGTQFNSAEFKQFLNENGIIHRQGAPYHPATNGQVERFIQTFKNKMKSMNVKPSTLENELSKFLLAYRRSLHSTTNKSPAMVMFGRQIQSRLELLLPGKEVKPNLRSVPCKTFEVGERVAVREYLSNEKWRFGTVKQSKGDLHYQVELDDSRTWTRHADQMRKVGKQIAEDNVNEPVIPPSIAPSILDATETSPVQPISSLIRQSHISDLPAVSQESSSNVNNPVETVRRSDRQRKAPERLQYTN